MSHNPEDVYPRHNLAITYLNQKDYEKAAFYFGKNIGSRSKPAVSLAWRGLSYLYLGRYDEALKDYAELDRLKEPTPDLKTLDKHCINYNYGWINAQLGLNEQAVRFFSKVDQDTKLWPDTEIWLDWLNKNNQPVTIHVDVEELPGFCTKVLLRMRYSTR